MTDAEACTILAKLEAHLAEREETRIRAMSLEPELYSTEDLRALVRLLKYQLGQK